MTAEKPEKSFYLKRWLYIFSPCILAALFCLWGIIEGYLNKESSGGWSYLGVIIFIPVLITVLLVDLIVKLLFRKKLLYAWLTEALSIIVIYMIFIKHYL